MKKSKLLLLLGVALFASVSLTSCKDDDDDDDNGGGGGGSFTVNTPATVVGTIDGTNLTLTNGFGLVGWDGGIDPDGSDINFITGMQQSFDEEEPALYIRLGNVYYADNDFDNSAKFYNYITLGNNAYAYGIGNTSGTTTKKVDVEYTDASGSTWGTSGGSQAGSTFEIVDTVHYSFFGNLGVKLKAKLNCKLYDGMGGVKTLNITNYIGAVESYQ